MEGDPKSPRGPVDSHRPQFHHWDAIGRRVVGPSFLDLGNPGAQPRPRRGTNRVQPDTGQAADEEAGYEDAFYITLIPSIRDVPTVAEICEAISESWVRDRRRRQNSEGVLSKHRPPNRSPGL